MRRRTLVLAALAGAALAVLAAPAAAEESTADRAQGDTIEFALQEGTRVVAEGEQSSIVRAFHEAWEEADTIEGSGWSQETVGESPEDPFRLVHRRADSPFPAPKASPIVTESRPHAVTVMTDEARYPAGVDARLVSPTLDLRYARGVSSSTAGPYQQDDTRAFLRSLQDAYDAASGPATDPYNYLLVTPPAKWAPIPCPGGSTGDTLCPSLSSPIYAQEQTIYSGGGESGAEAYEDGSLVVESQTLPGPVQDFIGSIPFLSVGGADRTPEQTLPRPGTRGFGLYADESGSVHAPNPVDEREGLSYINVTFWHAWELEDPDAAYLEVRERRADGEWSEWRHLEPDEVWNQPNATPSARYHEGTSDDRTLAYNGWEDKKRAFVGSSDGLVASTFNLNRFAGTEIQLAWRVDSDLPEQRPPQTLGWFIDDVVLWTNTYQRDVGIREVDSPAESDLVAESEPARPTATVRNYGHLPIHDVEVTFEVVPQGADEPTWTDSQTLDRLGPQEEVEVAATTPYDPASPGSYDFVASVDPYSAPTRPGRDNLTHRPQTAPDDDNDRRVVPFHVQDEPRADVAVDVDDEFVQTNTGVAKPFAVTMENTGNVPLRGTVEVTATRLNRSTLEPASDPHVVATVPVQPSEFPFGRNLNVFGAEDNTWTRSFEWSEGTETAGIYKLQASFDTPEGRFDGATTTYVRATPAPYYEQDADDLLDLSFSDSSVYSAGMRVTAWTAAASDEAYSESRASAIDVGITRQLPDPVSPKHVWYGRGDDGGVGTSTYGESAERTAGAPLDANDTYDRTEPDTRCRLDLFCPEDGATRDPNYVDHYWLTRQVDLRDYDAEDDLLLAFWHTGEFDWTGRSTDDQREGSHARGLVEVLPQRNSFLTRPDAGADDGGVDAPEPETGLQPVDERVDAQRNVTIVPAAGAYGRTVETYESSVPWTREVVDLSRWSDQNNVTLRFHLETTADRQRVNSSDHGPLTPWLIDNVELQAETDESRETVFSADLEGDDWKRWSTAEGIQVDDPRAPVAIAEGRGWDRFSYGSNTLPSGWHVTENRKRPEAGTLEPSPMLRWGDPGDVSELPPHVNLSILETPEFSLGDARDPALSFLTNYTFPDDMDGYPHWDDIAPRNEEPYTKAGGSVWIVGENDEGEVVKRELLEPAGDSEVGYDAFIAGRDSGGTDHCTSDEPDGSNELHCQTPLQHYPNASEIGDSLGGNVLTGRSGRAANEPGQSEWQRAVFDLSPYAESNPDQTPGAVDNASLTYHLEFHALNQDLRKVDTFGWLIDNVRVTERTFANDMAVDDVIQPEEKSAVGPGLKVPVALRLQNQGLYDQVGVEASYLVRNATGHVVYGPVSQRTDPGVAIPGEGNTANPDKNRSLVFRTPWETPQEEGRYVVEGHVRLSEAIPGHAFPDDNPANDVLRQEVVVDARRSVGIQPARVQPDTEVVDPFVDTAGTPRTFTVLVENKGTLPEVFTGDDAGDFNVNLTIRDAGDDPVQSVETSIRRLAPGEVREVTFRNAWQPDNTGVYDVSFRLEHPNETVSNPDVDNQRSLTYTVFEQFLPREGGTLEKMFRAEDVGWSFGNGSWDFGRGETYRTDADDTLALEGSLDLRALRRGVIRLNHSYAFETGYDGGLLEVKPADGDTWYPVPPEPVEEGYPVTMSPGSPLTPDPTADVQTLSGTSGEDGPATVETAFRIGGVDELTRQATIFDDDLCLDDADPDCLDGDGFGDTRSSLLGDWETQALSKVEPHSGDVMFHSNHTATERQCWRTGVENTGSFDCSTETAGDQFVEHYDTRKYLNVTFDDDLADDKQPLAQRAAKDDVESLQVVFWDYRAIGLPNPPGQGSKADAPNEVSVRLECEGPNCPGEDAIVLDGVDPEGYDDNYRGWTRNVHTLPARTVEPFTGPGKEIKLSFVHHLIVGDIEQRDSKGEKTFTWSTDAQSLHAGWFIDDVAINLVDSAGRTTTYWEDDLEDYGRVYKDGVENPNSPGSEVDACQADGATCDATQEILEIGPWEGTTWTLDHRLEKGFSRNRTLWDPVSGWGEDLWRHVEAGEDPCGDLLDEQWELADDYQYPKKENVDQGEDAFEGTFDDLYEADSDQFRACGPTRGHRDRAGGERLVTELNLRPAVGNVTLTFDHKYRFQNEQLPNQSSKTLGRSGGRLEVSVDGGDTWVPLQPSSTERSHRPMYAFADEEATAAHTTLGGREGDPEGNSIYGMGGEAFTGVSGPLPEKGASTEEDVTYDLSRFAGRKVQVAWHAFFNTYNQTEHGYEFWAVEDVEATADVFDGRRADLRLRAASDGSKGAQGWTVNDVEMAGVETSVNVGAEVRGVSADEPVEAGESPFEVALLNQGEDGVRVDVAVDVVDLSTGETALNASESDLHLSARSFEVRETVGGTELAPVLDAGTSYQVRASVTIVDRDTRLSEIIRSDNADEVTIDGDQIREETRVAVQDVRVVPNDIRTSPDDPVRVEVDVLNDGFAPRTTLRYLNVTWTPVTGGEAGLELTEDERVDAGGRNPEFTEPFQTKTWAWQVAPDRIEPLQGGIYEVTGTAVKDGTRVERSASGTAYVGPGFFQDLAFTEKVKNRTLQAHELCEDAGTDGPTSPIPWMTQNVNHSRWRSFGAQRVSSTGQQPPAYSGQLKCTVPDLDSLGEDLRLTFYTRYDFPADPGGSGENRFDVHFGAAERAERCTANTLLKNLLDVTRTTPDFVQGSWSRHTFSIPDDLREDGDDVGCVVFTARIAQNGGILRGANVDDIVVAPYETEINPSKTTARVSDNTVKRFPFEVRNAGSFNDEYRFAFVDADGERPTSIPRSWALSVETPEGEPVDTLEVPASSTRTLEVVVDIPVQSAGSASGRAEIPLSAISLTEELIRDTAVFDLRFDSPPRPNVAVLDVSVNNPDLAAGRPRSLTVTLANLGAATAEDIPLRITDTMPPRFGEAPKELGQIGGAPLPAPTLAPGQTTTLTAGWTPTRAGPHNLTVEVDPGGEIVESSLEDNRRVVEMPVGAANFPDLNVALSVSDDEPEAGSTIAVNGTITNDGNAPAKGVRVNLRVGVSDLLEGDAPHILEDIIEPGETIHLDTTWPASFPGEYQAFLKAFPLSGTLEPADTQDDNLEAEPVTVRSQALQIEAPGAGLNASQGEEVTTPLTLANRGDRDETVDLAADAAGDLRARVTRDGVSVTTVDVPAETAEELDLRVRTPARVAAGTYLVEVRAVSQETGQTQTFTLPVRVQEEPGLTLEASAVDVDPGGGELPLRVENTGNAPTTVNVTARDMPEGWSVDADPLKLEPFSSARLRADLAVPTDAPAGVRDISVQAVGETAASTAVRVDVGTRGVLDVAMEPDSVALRPGSTVTFKATLDSVGNVPAFPELQVDAPDDWSVTLPRPRARIPDGESVTVDVTADVPEDAAAGDHQVTLVAAGQDETFVGAADVRVGVPDLASTNVEQNPRVNVEAGEPVTFTTTVRNPGGLGVDDVGLGVYVDDALVDFGAIGNVSAGGASEVTLEWTAEAGEHVILVVADPGEDVAEEDEGNNARLLVVDVGGEAQVFGDVERAVPAPQALLGLVAFLGAALGRRWLS